MIYINKGIEPESLINYKKAFNAYFDGCDKNDLRNHLLIEQGYICAYCMKRIRNREDTKIEHLDPRNEENELLYSNLLAVCLGNEGNPEDQTTCDTKKGNDKICFSPLSIIDMNTIFYDSLGTLKSSNPAIDLDINKVLNLNYEFGYHISNRKAALRAFKKMLSKCPKGTDISPTLRKMKEICENRNVNGEYRAYVGILRWYVNSKLK